MAIQRLSGKSVFVPKYTDKTKLLTRLVVFFQQALEEEFSMNQSLMDSVESTCHELSDTTKGSAYLKMIKELEQLKAKWAAIHSKFLELKEQPGKKLEAEFETLHGQTLTDLDKIQRGIKKLKLESSEPRNIKSLLDKCVVCSLFVTLKPHWAGGGGGAIGTRNVPLVKGALSRIFSVSLNSENIYICVSQTYK